MYATKNEAADGLGTRLQEWYKLYLPLLVSNVEGLGHSQGDCFSLQERGSAAHLCKL